MAQFNIETSQRQAYLGPEGRPPVVTRTPQVGPWGTWRGWN